MIRVFLADDHGVLADGLRLLIEGEADLQWAGTVATGESLLSALEETRVDVLLLDINLPGKSGLELCALVKDKKELMLYRVAQELVTNIVKHANATHVIIQLSRHDGEMMLTVEGNGKGFSYPLNLLTSQPFHLSTLQPYILYLQQ